ncbi:MAG: CHAT domain-containing protein [Bacteroidales bacterium]|nr:CHAT domain-containing protein [Bacteroidales bacterium]
MLRIILLLSISLYSTIVFSTSFQRPDPNTLKELADNHFIARRYDSAVVYYNKAATEFHEVSDIRQYLYCKNQEAFSLGIQNRNKEALAICEKVIKEYPDSLKASKYDVYFFWKLALFNNRLHNYNLAYTYGINTKEIAESYYIFEGYMKIDILKILTSSARNLGLYDIGLGYAIESMKYNQSLNDYLNLSHAYNSMALIYKRFHDFNKALEYFKKSMEIREKHAPQWTPYVMVNVGEMYLEYGRVDSAFTWFQNTLTVLKNQGVRENLLYSAIYSSISVILAKQENFEQAIWYINKCLEVRSRYFKPDDIQNTDFIKTRAEILISSGDLSAAADDLNQLKEIILDKKNSPQIESLYHQVMAYHYAEGEKKFEAIQEHQKSIISLTRDFKDMDIFHLPDQNDFFYGKDRLLEAVIKKTGLLNELYLETGDPKYLKSVTDHYMFSLGLINMMIEDQSSMLSVSGLFRDFSHLYETAIKAAVSLNELYPDEKNYKDISSYMEASRMNHAKILFKLNRVINYGGIPDSVIYRKKELERMIAYNRIDSTENSENLSEKFKMEQELDYIQFLIKNENRNTDLIQNIDFDLLQQSQKKLDRNTIILQYYFGEEKLYLLASTKHSNKFITLDWSQKEKQDLDYFIRQLKMPGYDSSMVELNNRVYRSLGLDSVLTPDIQEIVVIPDRELYFIPFDALKDSDNNFLISKYTIYTENSLFFMNANRRNVDNSISLLGLAPFADIENGSVGMDDTLKRSRSDDLFPLPGSKNEIEMIQKQLGGVIKIGSSATEKFFRENAEKAEIIHLSSHSFLDDTDPFFNSIVLASESGIDDGYLHTHELYGLNLAAELVTLSACNTGVGRYLDGEGMISLATGFRSAGVKNIVMSLWNLPDDATSEVMINFYSYLRAGEKKADALRLAKLDYLKSADQNTSSPYFWGASVFIGTNSPIALKNNYLNIFAGIISVVLLVTALYWYRKKRSQKLKQDQIN